MPKRKWASQASGSAEETTAAKYEDDGFLRKLFKSVTGLFWRGRNGSEPCNNNGDIAQGINSTEPAAEEEEEEGEPGADATCALCHDLFIDPITTPCGHTFCSLCHRHFFHVTESSAPATRYDVYLKVLPCPLCRENISVKQHVSATELKALLLSKYPKKHAEREIEVAAARQAMEDEYGVYALTMSAGTKDYHIIDRNGPRTRTSSRKSSRYQWTSWVSLGSPELDEQYIDRVEYYNESYIAEDIDVSNLVPNFETVTQAPFELPLIGNRQCTQATACVYFKPGFDLRVVPLVITLDKESGDAPTSWSYKFELSRRLPGIDHSWSSQRHLYFERMRSFSLCWAYMVDERYNICIGCDVFRVMLGEDLAHTEVVPLSELVLVSDSE